MQGTQKSQAEWLLELEDEDRGRQREDTAESDRCQAAAPGRMECVVDKVGS
jgi:hypothetical protein